MVALAVAVREDENSLLVVSLRYPLLFNLHISRTEKT